MVFVCVERDELRTPKRKRRRGPPHPTWKDTRYERRSTYGHQLGRHGRQGDQQKRARELDCPEYFEKYGKNEEVNSEHDGLAAE